ncbi:hypothetical protein GX563_09480 [Candidatus Bathyarchaeota archaeon]|nr:hypothetical protein [Candidatus Bathyarchaeota archaeon]
MGQSEYATSKARNQKRLVGIVAIVLITVFFILSFTGYIPFLIMLILDVIVWGIANLVLRRIGRVPL